MPIKSPYNFVPLTEKVFFPDWAARISHDIPFSDGLSGKIRVRITAASPIFVRDASATPDDKSGPFCQTPDGRYYIPGSSLKGAVRSILEILSNGKLRVQRSLDFAQREWDNADLYDLKKKQDKLRCGWLRWNEEIGYHIVCCDKPFRVSHVEIDKYYQSWSGDKSHPFMWHFCKENSDNPMLMEQIKRERRFRGYDLTKDYKYEGELFDPKTCAFKYAVMKHNGAKMPLRVHYTEIVKDNKNSQRRVALHAYGDTEGYEGTLVFTGQPDQWKYPRPKQVDSRAGKFYEYVFKDPEQAAKTISITDEQYAEYQEIYKDSPDWKFWSGELYNDGIPVFYLEDPKAGDEGRLKWGLSMLFKLPYDKTPYETLPDDHRSSRLDLADCIFGFTPTSKERTEALRGRVSVGHAFCISPSPKTLPMRKLVLGTPKASYYPLYVGQEGRNGIVASYNTYNKGQLAGWKRYMVKRSAFTPTAEPENKNIMTEMTPLAEGTQFESLIRFHNLRPAELGALLSALTFHNRRSCFYQLGQGKPYGYGKSRLDVKLERVEGRDASTDIAAYLDAFEQELFRNKLIVNDAYLVEIAQNEVEGEAYDYMKMSNDKDANEFVNAKKERAFLPRFHVAEAEKQKADANMRRREAGERAEAERIERERQAELARKQQELAEAEELVNRLKGEKKAALAATPFAEWLESQKISSIPAFTGQLKKWLEAGGAVLGSAEVDAVTAKLAQQRDSLKKADLKKWQSPKIWTELNALLGIDLYKQLFN